MSIRNPLIEASLEQYRELLRGDLQTFIQRCFVQLNPHARLSLNWHLEGIRPSWKRAAAAKSSGSHQSAATAS